MTLEIDWEHLERSLLRMNARSAFAMDDFDPNQKRANDGKWTSGGGSGKAKKPKSEKSATPKPKAAKAKEEKKKAEPKPKAEKKPSEVTAKPPKGEKAAKSPAEKPAKQPAPKKEKAVKAPMDVNAHVKKLEAALGKPEFESVYKALTLDKSIGVKEAKAISKAFFGSPGKSRGKALELVERRHKNLLQSREEGRVYGGRTAA